MHGFLRFLLYRFPLTNLFFLLLLCLFCISICYAYAVWNRIPYAASNLRTALTAVRLNMGLVVVAYAFMVLAFGWTLLFFMGFGNSLQQASYPVLFCWLVSFYWVHQVLQYTVHVICAGKKEQVFIVDACRIIIIIEWSTYFLDDDLNMFLLFSIFFLFIMTQVLSLRGGSRPWKPRRSFPRLYRIRPFGRWRIPLGVFALARF